MFLLYGTAEVSLIPTIMDLGIKMGYHYYVKPLASLN